MIEGIILAAIAACSLLIPIYLLCFIREARRSKACILEAIEKFRRQEWSVHEAAAYANMDPAEFVATFTFKTGISVSVNDASKKGWTDVSKRSGDWDDDTGWGD